MRMWMLMVGESIFEKMCVCVRMTTVILCFNAGKAHAIFSLFLSTLWTGCCCAIALFAVVAKG